MPRQPRSCPGGFVYHVWNRAAGRLRFFKRDADYFAFEKVMIDAYQRHPLPILDWCLMPNHWHFVVYPDKNKQLTHFFRWMSHTHSMRWHTNRNVIGNGPLYQGRFKTLPVQDDGHLLTLLRYVDRNPLRADLVKRAEQWRWGGEYVRKSRAHPLKELLIEWPIERPKDWTRWLNEPQTDTEEVAIRESIKRSRPYGEDRWVKTTAKQLNLEWSIRPRGGQKLPSRAASPSWLSN